MYYSGTGLNLTSRSEGLRLKAYQDSVGRWTIGYGHTGGVKEGDECSNDDALAWLEGDISRVVDQINRDVRVKLTQGEFDALVDFGYNLGVYALEHSTLWTKLQAGDFDGAAAQFPLWDHAGGVEVAGLLTRRLAEQAEFKGDVA